MTKGFVSVLSAMLLCLATIGEANAEGTLCEGILKVYRSGKIGFYELIERRLADHEIDPENDHPGTFLPNFYLPDAEHCAIAPEGNVYYCILNGTKEPDEAQVFLSQTFAGIKSCLMENEPDDWIWRYRTREGKIVQKEPKSWYVGWLNPNLSTRDPSVSIRYGGDEKVTIGFACSRRCKR